MYVNPETGQRYTYDELVGLAGGVELVDQYISQNGLAELGDVEEIETENIDFQQVTVPNAGASVVTDIDPAPENTELDLENISLASATDVFDEDPFKELKQAKANLAHFNNELFDPNNGRAGLAQRKKLEKLVKDAQTKIEQGDINLEIPETIIRKGNEEVILALQGEFSGIVFDDNSYFLDDKITANLGGDKVTLDLNPLTEKGEKEFFENYKKIQEYEKTIKAKNAFEQGAFSNIMNAFDSGALNVEDVNDNLKDTAYTFEPVEQEGLVIGYELKQNGQVVASDIFNQEIEGPVRIGNTDSIENYIAKNFTKEDLSKSMANMYPLLSTHLKTLDLEETKRIDAVNSKPDEELFDYDVLSGQFSKLADILKNKEYFTEAEQKAIDYMLKFSANPEGRGEYVDSGSMFTEDELVMLTPEEQLDYVRNLDFLDTMQFADEGVRIDNAALKEKLLNNNLWSNAIDYSVKTQREGAIAKAKQTAAESVMYDYDRRERELVRIGLLVQNAGYDIIKDEIKSEAKIIQNYNDTTSSIIEGEINLIANSLKDIPAKIGYTKTDGIVDNTLFFNLETTKELTEDQQQVYNEANARLITLQNTLGRLESDYKKTIENYVNHVAEASQFREDTNVVVGKDEEGKDVKRNILNEFGSVFKEYEIGSLVAKDFTDASYNIALALPTLFNSEWAINEQKALQRKEEYYKSSAAYDDAFGEGEFGLYSVRTLFQQAPNIILAIGTGSAGNALKLSDGLVKTSIASTFGVTSGTDMYRNLSVQADLLDMANKQVETLNSLWEAGRIDQFDYSQGLLDAEKTIAMGEMTPFQISAASVATGIIEGGVTRYIGSANNTFKFLKDVKGQGQINIYNLFNKPSLNAWGSFAIEGGKRIGGELVEENLIYGGTQGISESLILQRDADWSQFDDTTLATLITAGFANTSGIATSAITQMSATKKFREKINKATSEVQEMVNLMNGPGVSQNQRKTFTAAIKQKLIDIGAEQTALGVDVIALGSENVVDLVGLNVLKNNLLSEAGVTPDMDSNQAQNQIDNYKKEKLTNVEAERFDQNLNSLDTNINSIKEGNKNYDNVETLLGDAGRKARLNLDENTPNWNGKLDKRQELAQVVEEIHRMETESYVNKAKEDTEIQKEWEQLKENAASKYEGDKRKKEYKEKINALQDAFYAQSGRALFDQDTRVVTVSSDIDFKADQLMARENIGALKIIEIPNIEDQISYLYTLAENGKINPKDISLFTDKLKQGGNGFIVDNEYITINKEAADQAMKNGDIRAGVVVYHEISHAIDESYFDTKEEFNKYTDNLYKATSTSENPVLRSLNTKVENALLSNEEYSNDARNDKGELLPFNERGDTFKIEYAAEMQSLSYALEKELNLEDTYGTQNILSKLANRAGFGLKVNTPEKALSYLIGNNAAFRRGEFTSQVRAKVGKEGIKPRQGVNDSKQIADRINIRFEGKENFKPILPKDVDTMVNKVANRAWTRFGSGVPLNIREVHYSRRTYLDHAKSKLREIALKWDPSLGTFPSFMANRGMQRANAFATDLGVPKGKANVRIGEDNAAENVRSTDNTETLNRRAEVEAKEVKPTLKEKVKFSNQAEVENKLEQKLGKEIRYRLPKYNADTTTKQKTDFVNELGKGMQGSFKIVIDAMGARNKTINLYEQFLNENYATLLGPNGLTTTYLAKAFPLAVEKYVNGMGWVKYDKWKGRTKGSKDGQVDFYRSTELGPMAGSTAGNQKIRRVKDIKNAIPLAKFKSKYIKLDNGKLKIPQMPTEALAKQIAQEIGLDMFNEQIQDVDSEIRRDFIERQEFFGADILDNYVEQLMYDVSRPSVKDQLALFTDGERTDWLDNRTRFYDEVKRLNLQELTSTQIKTKLKNAHKAVYGDRFTNEQHIGVANQFGNLLVPQRKTGVLETEQEWFDYLETVITNIDNVENVVKYTGAEQANSVSLRDMSTMQNARDFVEINLYKALKASYGSERALDMMVAFVPPSFSNGMKKAGGFTPQPNNTLLRNPSNMSVRAGIFGDMSDTLRLIQRIDDGVVSISDKTIKFNDGRPDRKVDINTSADVLMQYVNGKFEKSKENTEDKDGNTVVSLQNKNKIDSDLAWNFFIDFMKALNASGLDNNTTSLLMGVMNGSNNSALRLAAPVWGRSTKMPYDTLKIPMVRDGKLVKKPNGEQKYEPAYRYEHAIPARAVLFFAYESIFNGNKEIDLDLLKDDYRVTIIPVKEMDDVLGNTGFTQSMLIGYQPGKQEWWKRYYNIFTKGKMPFGLQSYETGDVVGQEFEDFYNSTNGTTGVSLNAQQVIDKNNNADIAMEKARQSLKDSKKLKKIRIFDFDDTLAQSKSMVIVNMPDGSSSRINATEFATDAARLESEGAVFDFAEFSKVVEGKKGPLFDVAKKIADARGSEDLFVLTARPQDAAGPIQEFLASVGLNIPLQNITGLADGKAQAKADWVINKFAEGYNDFYFTDDATKNVKAVKDALDVLDVKSRVQIARVKFQKDLDFEFNKMIERNKGVKAEARYSQVVAQRLGKNKKRFNLFLPPSAEDFKGLTSYMFAGKGKQGEMDQDFFDKALIRPYTSAVAAIETAKQRVSNDYRNLMANFPEIKKVLRSKIPGEQFTYDEAVRVYLWDQADFEIPGISNRDRNILTKIVREDPNLQSFADGILLITKKDTYVEPPTYWQGQTILGDLNTITTKVNRAEYLSEFNENVDVIFSEQNLTKIEAVYGSRVRESLENIIWRMKNGTNRPKGSDRQTNAWMNWLNRSIGAIMFFNRRSALLQLISSVNFINWSDNNPFMAGKAFANQNQYWSDVVMLFNSDKLKQRRAGLKGDINEAEIAAAVKGSKNKMSTFISILLRNGFVFTQVADSVAIATGGATFYRNRINTYKKQGLSQTEAETKAFEDFSRTSEESQQSADPSMISQQQAGMLGRFLLNFQNTPMQYTRLMKKAGLDLVNGRGDAKTNISKIVYYGIVQNLIFSTLQNALFAMIPGFDEPDDELTEEEQLKKYGEVLSKKEDRIANSMIDTILRGSGVGGAVISTIKNAIRRYNFEEKKGFTADHTYTVLELANLSPALGSKLRKIYSAIQTKKFERDVIAEKGFSVTIDGRFQLSPSYQVVGSVVSGAANIPMDRMVAEINAITEAFDNRNTIYQRVALALGFRTWDVNSKIEEFDLIKADAKIRRKEEGKIKAKETRKRKAQEKARLKKLEEEKYNNMSEDQKLEYDLKKDKEFQEKIDSAIEKAMEKLDKLYNE